MEQLKNEKSEINSKNLLKIERRKPCQTTTFIKRRVKPIHCFYVDGM